jgi:WD40-like Beta Propeller Repeat
MRKNPNGGSTIRGSGVECPKRTISVRPRHRAWIRQPSEGGKFVNVRTLARTGLIAAAALVATSLLPIGAANAALDTPTVTITGQTKGIVDLEWTAVGGETGYSIQRGTAADSLNEIATVAAPTLTFQDTGLTPGLTYYYAVLATDGVGASAPQDPPAQTEPIASKALLYTIDVAASSETILASAPIVGGIESPNYVTLARSTKPISGLSVSPDGTRVVYTQDDSSTDSNLYVRKVDGSDAPKQLTSAAGQEFFATWSPNSATILFSQFSGNADFIGDLKTVPAIGGAVANLAANGGAGHEAGTYTPDGASIIAVNDVYWENTGDPILSKISVSTGARSTISGSLGMAAPTVSPDGTRIAGECYDYSPTAVLGSYICTLPAAGGTLTKVSSLASGGAGEYAEDDAAEWNSDGSRIHFSRYFETATEYGQKLGSVLVNGTGQSIAPAINETFNAYPQTSSVDVLAPISFVTAPTATSTLGTTVAVAWGGFDRGGNGVASYDLRQTRFSYTGARVDTNLLTSTSLRSKTVSVARGNVYCFSVRAKDNLGNTTTAFSAARCLTIPLDQTSFARSAGWFTPTGSAYYGGSAASIAKKSATLTRTGVKAKQIGVVVRTCSTCGSVAVYIGATKIGTVSTRSSVGAYKKLIWLPASSTLRSGTLKLVTTSTAKVFIDGVAIKSA